MPVPQPGGPRTGLNLDEAALLEWLLDGGLELTLEHQDTARRALGELAERRRAGALYGVKRPAGGVLSRLGDEVRDHLAAELNPEAPAVGRDATLNDARSTVRADLIDLALNGSRDADATADAAMLEGLATALVRLDALIDAEARRGAPDNGLERVAQAARSLLTTVTEQNLSAEHFPGRLEPVRIDLEHLNDVLDEAGR